MKICSTGESVIEEDTGKAKLEFTATLTLICHFRENTMFVITVYGIHFYKNVPNELVT